MNSKVTVERKADKALAKIEQRDRRRIVNVTNIGKRDTIYREV